MSVLMTGLMLATKRLHLEFEWGGHSYSVCASRAPLERGPGYIVELTLLDAPDGAGGDDGTLVLDNLFAVNAERAVEQMAELGTRAVEGAYPLSPEGIAARQERARLLEEFTERRKNLPQLAFGPYPRVTEVVEATERPEPVPDHEARWTVRFPYIDDMGSVAPIHGMQDKVTETKEEEALWHLNDMRKHDGLPPRKSLPKGTTFERTTPLEHVVAEFRVFPEGDVIALLLSQREKPGFVGSYQSLGQHSPASLELRSSLRRATPEERGPLLRELTQIGYDVREWHDDTSLPGVKEV